MLAELEGGCPAEFSLHAGSRMVLQGLAEGEEDDGASLGWGRQPSPQSPCLIHNGCNDYFFIL